MRASASLRLVTRSAKPVSSTSRSRHQTPNKTVASSQGNQVRFRSNTAKIFPQSVPQKAKAQARAHSPQFLLKRTTPTQVSTSTFNIGFKAIRTFASVPDSSSPQFRHNPPTTPNTSVVTLEDKYSNVPAINEGYPRFDSPIIHMKPLEAFKKLMKRFTQGGLQFYRDGRSASKFAALPLQKRTLKEQKLIEQFKDDVAVGIPFMIVFFLPIIGYFTLLVAVFAPQVLPSTFKTNFEKIRGFETIYQNRKKALGATTTAALSLLSSREASEQPQKGELSEAVIARFEKAVANNNFVVSFEDVAAAFGYGGAWRFIPAKYRTRLVHDRLQQLFVEDQFLRRDGTEGLTDIELAEIMYTRGITPSLSPETDKAKLKKWLNFTSTLTRVKSGDDVRPIHMSNDEILFYGALIDIQARLLEDENSVDPDIYRQKIRALPIEKASK